MHACMHAYIHIYILGVNSVNIPFNPIIFASTTIPAAPVDDHIADAQNQGSTAWVTETSGKAMESCGKSMEIHWKIQWFFGNEYLMYGKYNFNPSIHICGYMLWKSMDTQWKSMNNLGAYGFSVASSCPIATPWPHHQVSGWSSGMCRRAGRCGRSVVKFSLQGNHQRSPDRSAPWNLGVQAWESPPAQVGISWGNPKMDGS